MASENEIYSALVDTGQPAALERIADALELLALKAPHPGDVGLLREDAIADLEQKITRSVVEPDQEES